MHLPPALLSVSNPASAGGHLPNPNDWPKGLFQILMVVSLAILLSPFLIWFLWKRWSNLGSWKLHKGSNAAKRKRYIRTWHGWVEQEKYLQRKEMRSRFRHSMSRKLMWKTTTSDYAWVFWDPSGEKQQAYSNRRNQTWIRHLPRWMRSYQHGTVQPSFRPLDLNTAERGMPLGSPMHPTLRIQSSDSISFHEGNRFQTDRYGQIDGESTTKIDQTGITSMGGALLDVEDEPQASTIRHCRELDGSFQTWRANSVETRRATSRLLFKPNKDTRQHPRHTVMGKPPYSPFPVSPITNALGFDHKDHRMASLPSLTRPEPFQMEESESPRALDTSEVEKIWVRREKLVYPIARSIRHLSGWPDLPDDRKLPARVGHQLIGHGRQMIKNPCRRTGSAAYGTLNKVIIPILSSTRAKAPSSSFHSDIGAYEADGSLDGAMPSRASSVIAAKDHSSNPPEIQEPWYQKTSVCWSNKWKKPVDQHLELCQASPGGSALWSKAMSGGTSNSYTTSASCLMHPKRRRLVDRAICASPPSEDEVGKRNEVPTPAVLLNDCPQNTQPPESTKRTPSPYPGVNATKSITFPKPLHDAESTSCFDKHETKNGGDALFAIQDFNSSCTVLTQQELRFANDLHRRLDRLHYELSPGFRAPTSEEIDKLYFGPVPLSTAGPSADVVGRATQANIRRLSVRRGKSRGSDSDPPRQSQLHRTETQKLNSWRATINKVRRLSGGEEMLKYIPNRKVGFIEPEEGAIDVAAWILRRPPQGFPDMNLTQDTLFTGVHGKMRTQAEWNAISIPKTVLPLKRALSNLSSPRNSTKKLRPVESMMNVRHVWEGRKRNADEFKENIRLTEGPRSLDERV